MSKVVEIPIGKRSPRYRFFEILPFALSIGVVVGLVVASWVSPIFGAIYLFLIVIMSLVKAIGIAYRTVQGYSMLERSHRVNWHKRLLDLENA